MRDAADVDEYERRILKLEVENEAIAGLKERIAELELDSEVEPLRARVKDLEKEAKKAGTHKTRIKELENEIEALSATAEESMALAEENSIKLKYSEKRTHWDVQTENYLREQVKLGLAHRVPACACPGERGECPPLREAVINVLVTAAPHAAKKLAYTAQLLISVHGANQFIKTLSGTRTDEIRNMVRHTGDTLNTLLHTGYNEELAPQLLRELKVFCKQIRCFVGAMKVAEIKQDTRELHVALLKVAIDELNKVLAKAKSLPLTPILSKTATASLAEQLSALVVAERLEYKSKGPDSAGGKDHDNNNNNKNSEQEGDVVPSKVLTEAQDKIKGLEAEIENLKVQSSLFESQLEYAHRIEKDVEGLRAQLVAKDAEMEKMKAKYEAKLLAKEAALGKSKENQMVSERSKAILSMNEIYHKRIKALLAANGRLLLADIGDDRDSAEEGERKKQIELTRTSAHHSLIICRRAAAGAQVVDLDENTLLPRAQGESLSMSSAGEAAEVASAAIQRLISERNHAECRYVKVGGDVVKELAQKPRILDLLLP